MLGGHHVRPTTTINWEISASRSYEVDSAGNPKADFAWIGPKVYCNYVPQGVTNYPTFGLCDAAGSVLQNAQLWALKDLTTSTGLTAQLNLTAAASYAKRYETNGHHRHH